MMIPALVQRVTSSVLLVALLLAVLVWAPVTVLLLILLAVASLATLEFYRLLRAADLPHYPWVGVVCGNALLAAIGLRFYFPGLPAGAAEANALFLATVLVLLRQFPQKLNPRPLETMAGTLLGVLYAPFLLSFLVRLLLQWDVAGNRWIIFFPILIVKAGDSGAYFVGCSLGRHKLIPRLSPNKTWEGFFGGLAFALAAGLLWWHFSGGCIGPLRLPLLHAIVLPLLIALAGVMGDLTESLMKRAAGVKDSAGYIQGLGGVLDVIDSILFAAPTMFFYALVFLRTAH
ncbi:MAG: phosphatidate cytidylyltransferase [Kiritimatiellaeota bacterium]|nr:phosphatidate cytidylyltransferase [Kiritimatiellota bacterium]